MIAAASFIFIVYAIFIIYSIAGQHDSINEHPPKPFVSIIVVCRNEAENLPACLDSLHRLDYPESRYEIWLVNDRSDDDTAQIMERFAKNRKTCHVIHLSQCPQGLTGKMNGLARATVQCRGEFLFFTDADCRVPPAWIQAHLSSYHSKTGLCGGAVYLDLNSSPFFHRLQSLEWLHLSAAGWGWAGHQHPLSAFGNNLSVRRRTYDDCGGFASLAGHPLEDYALVRLIQDKTAWKITFNARGPCAVYSRPLSFRQWLSQQRRWAVGARYHKWRTWKLMILAAIRHLTLLVLILSGFWPEALIFWAGTTVFDGWLLFRLLKNLDKLPLLRDFPAYGLLFSVGILLAAPFILFSPSYHWKGIEYDAYSTTRRLP